MIKKISEVLLQERPDYVLVLGDTNTVLAGSLAANRLGLTLIHIEGGLRSFDIVMAEEVNRMIADYLSELIFIPTMNARENLFKEGVSKSKIIYSGNTIVDSVYQNLKIAQKKINVLKAIGLEEKNYFLVTLHRAENVDIKERLAGILDGFGLVYKKFNIPLVLPMHPRTKKMIKNFGLRVPKGVRILEPLSFLEFLLLESMAKLILTDSGGLQEEACILKVPCVTLRDNTERPETIEIGANMLCGTESSRIYSGVNTMLTKKIKWSNPFGDGKSAERIICVLTRYNKSQSNKKKSRRNR
jgi:UDP-N-acetylglucosamine 2-epimerase (non-hydrolysing)